MKIHAEELAEVAILLHSFSGTNDGAGSVYTEDIYLGEGSVEVMSMGDSDLLGHLRHSEDDGWWFDPVADEGKGQG